MAPFNISSKQLKLNNWLPRYKHRWVRSRVGKKVCYDCTKKYNGRDFKGCGYEVGWDKVQEGDPYKTRCCYCKQCLWSSCCRRCGYDYTTTGKFKVSEDNCEYCTYLDRYGPDGYESGCLDDGYEDEEELTLEERFDKYNRTIMEMFPPGRRYSRR